MKILVLHHTDLDGSTSAAIVGLYHLYRHETDITYKMFNYGWMLSPEDFQGYDLIYAVDISFGQDNPWVYQIPNLIWIDHHKSAIEYESNHPELSSIPGLRQIGVGACELTWEYLFPEYQCPEIVKILSTYDVWDKSRMDWGMVNEVEAGAKHILGISPKNMMDFLLYPGNISDLKGIGRTLLGYIEKSGKGKLSGGGFWIPDFYGYRCIALNTPEFSSLSFMSYYTPEVADICMPFQVTPIEGRPGEFMVRVSLYSENPEIDVSVIAKSYGGGGHRGASGFQTSLEELSRILSTGKSLKEYFREIEWKGNKPVYYENKKCI